MNIKYNYNKKIETLFADQIFITGFRRSGTYTIAYDQIATYWTQ